MALAWQHCHIMHNEMTANCRQQKQNSSWLWEFGSVMIVVAVVPAIKTGEWHIVNSCIWVRTVLVIVPREKNRLNLR